MHAEVEQTRRRGRLKTALTVLVAVVLTPLTIWLGTKVPGNGYYLSGTLIVAYSIVPFLVSFEGRRPQARELAVLAVMAALAVASRAVFIWVPHFKPMAAIVMVAGMAFGPQAGFLVGTVSVLASNFIFGQGPWTPWQMLAFGVAGLIGGALTGTGLFPRQGLSWPRRVALAAVGFLTILCVSGPILDTSTLFTMMAFLTPGSAVAIYLAGAPINAIHGSAVALTLLLVANPLLDQLARVRDKYGVLAGGGGKG